MTKDIIMWKDDDCGHCEATKAVIRANPMLENRIEIKDVQEAPEKVFDKLEGVPAFTDRSGKIITEGEQDNAGLCKLVFKDKEMLTECRSAKKG